MRSHNLLGVGRCFNSRPCEGATLTTLLQKGQNTGFNSRPCEGATTEPITELALQRVSIHAPVKGRPALNNSRSHWAEFQFTPL